MFQMKEKLRAPWLPAGALKTFQLINYITAQMYVLGDQAEYGETL